jgi:D-alanyl-D-alanine endopeptidase (penicillin-binding protein 7)
MGKILTSIIPKSRVGRYAFLAVSGVFLFLLVGYNLNPTRSTAISLPVLVHQNQFEFNLPDSNICKGIRLRVKSGIAIDNESHQVLYCYNADAVQPVASISKLLTAMVVLDNYRPDTVITISSEDCYKSSRSILRKGDQVKVRDLLHAALLRSDNRAARAITSSICGSIEEFAKKMNMKAHEIGMGNTEMFEPTGLDERNRSTAADCAKLVNYAMLYPEIARITSLKEYTFRPLNKKRNKKIYNTNKLVFSNYKVVAGKTGYINESDYCLTTIIENGKGKRLTVVVLGAPGPQTRFREARRLATWAFNKLGNS